MRFSKLRISAEATSKIRSLRQRSGLRPNLLCRIALMLSLEEGSASARPVPPDDGQEFNRYTLTGDYDALFIGLLKIVEGEKSDEELLALLRAHIHEGIGRLSVRVKRPVDIAMLVPAAE